MKNFISYAEIEHFIFEIQSNQTAIKAVKFVDNVGVSSKEIPEVLKKCEAQLRAYFKKDLKVFELELDAEGTAFQKKVWHKLLEIPFGKTLNYAQMAKNMGDPLVIRAAASANGKNPIAIIIPCHRVIGSDGSLTGYAGGIDKKKYLLELENANGVINLF